MEDQRKVVLYIALSIDGYIAKPNDDLGFLSMVEEAGEDYGYAKFMESIDTVIVGRKTYDKILSMGVSEPYPGKHAYVITRQARNSEEGLSFYTDSLDVLIKRLKGVQGKHIYCDGGAQLVNELLKKDLIDECILSIIPVFLGAGIRLFQDDRPEQRFTLISSKSFKKGLVQLHYSRAR